MSERTEYAPGEFGWVDLASPDIQASVEFYGRLMGWEHVPAPGSAEQTRGYGYFTYGGKQVAGVGPIMGEGQPPAWSSYVYVADVDETAAKVTAAGGAVLMGPFDIPGEAGRMAVCHDPQGAFFSVWQPNRHRGAELVNEVGAWTWNVLITSDLEAAGAFYGDVFGWRLESRPEAPDNPYKAWHVEGERWPEGLANGAQTGAPGIPEGLPPHWQVYLAVQDADRAVQQTRDAGGQVFVEPLKVPVGRIAVMNDPQGAAFAIMEPDFPEPR